MIGRLFSRRSFAGKTVVILGGSRGLGLEMARLWGAEGARLALAARTGKDLGRAIRELRSQGIAVIGCACDIRSAAEVQQFIHSAVECWGSIDVLVNNAGIIQVGPFDCMTEEDFQAAMETHFWGPYHAIQTAVPYMLEQGSGRIVNIASIGGKVSAPHMLPYCTSKFALVGFSEGLRTELIDKGIYVTTVVPGLMRTGSPRNAQFKGQHRKEYAWFSIADSIPLVSMSSRRAARQIIRASRRGRSHIALSLPCKLAIRFHGVFPIVTAAMLRLTNHFLPAATARCTENHQGTESFSQWSPSRLTRLTEKAAARNNEVR